MHTIGDSLTQFQKMDMDAPMYLFLHMHINWRLQFLQQYIITPTLYNAEKQPES